MTRADAAQYSAPSELRRAIRAGRHKGHTSGFAAGYAQGNLVVLPEAFAGNFLRFCQRNPKPCPLLGMSEPGDPCIPALGLDLDIRTDIPGYCVFRQGVMEQEVSDLRSLWRDDFVAFVLGCSFSFEAALIENGVPLRHIQQGKNVAMYRTSVANKAAGPFAGNMVVSMRPMRAADAIRAIQITSRFPAVHGAPVHVGDPALLGIADISKPDFGDPVDVLTDELPVFWACGVTPQEAIRAAKPALAITHKPGSMLVTDMPNHVLSIF
jgi:uncharacterized protein YcsI (UPF0317 family)